MTAKELYDTLIRKPNLHSLPELHDQLLVWPLYKNAFIQAYCDHSITCIDIISNSLFSGSLMHWHPDESEMLDELVHIWQKGEHFGFEKDPVRHLRSLHRPRRNLSLFP